MAFNKDSVRAFVFDNGHMMSCGDVPEPKPNCCYSCHDDDSEGYISLSEVFDGDDNPIARFCCIMISHMEEGDGKS